MAVAKMLKLRIWDDWLRPKPAQNVEIVKSCEINRHKLQIPPQVEANTQDLGTTVTKLQGSKRRTTVTDADSNNMQ